MKSNESSTAAGRADVSLRSHLSDRSWSCQARRRAPQGHGTRWVRAEQGCLCHDLLPGLGTFQPQLPHGRHRPEADALRVAAAQQPAAPAQQHPWGRKGHPVSNPPLLSALTPGVLLGARPSFHPSRAAWV